MASKYKAYLRVPDTTYHISFREDGKLHCFNGGYAFLGDFVTISTDETYLAVFAEESQIHGYSRTAQEAIDNLINALTVEIVAPAGHLNSNRDLLIAGIEGLRELGELANGI